MGVNISNILLKQPGVSASLRIDPNKLTVRIRNMLLKAIRTGNHKGGATGYMANYLCAEFRLPRRGGNWGGRQSLRGVADCPDEYIRALQLATRACDAEPHLYACYGLLYVHVSEDTPILLPLHEQEWYQRKSEPLLRMLETGAVITCHL